MAAILTILVFIAAFAAMYRTTAGSHVAVLAGAAAVVVIGALSGTYSLRMAMDSIYFETLALIFGMSAISTLLARSGVFAYLAAGTAEQSKGNVTWVLVMMSLVTYGISLTTNNIATMVGFVFAGLLNVRPGWIAFVAGLAAMVVGRFKDEEAFHACGGDDILFFIGLFIMVGGLMAAGVHDWLTWVIESVTAQHGGLRAVVLMWVVAGVTLFVGGGTAAAAFAPIAASMSLGYENQASWWAVSLGVMAGSSGALSGATSGSMVMTQYNRFIARHPEMLQAIPKGGGLTHQEYMRWAMPLMGMLLVASTLYILAISG